MRTIPHNSSLGEGAMICLFCVFFNTGLLACGRSVLFESRFECSATKKGTIMVPFFVVEHTGLEPVTPTLPVSCAPSCANAPWDVLFPIARI